MIENQEENELSKHYFTKCEELQVVQEPFELRRSHLERKRRDLESEFQLLRALTQTKKHKNKLRINSIVENKKNRYPEQSIYEHNRVELPDEDSEVSTYINANYIPLSLSKRVIITQAPLDSTQQDFQEMLRQQKIECVIMLCNVFENGKVRCFDYTENRQTESVKQIGNYLSVTKVGIQAEEEEEEPFEYVHIHYSEWPDRGVPQQPRHIRQVILETLKYDRIVIHCSAGLGRSGVLASILFLQLKLMQNQPISIFGTVRRLREYRYGSVQNNEQYKFIYDYLYEIYKDDE